MVTALNLRHEDDLPRIEKRIRNAFVSMPVLQIKDHEVDLVPVFYPTNHDAAVARINVELWERDDRTKEVPQELAERIAAAFREVAGENRRVKVVIKPYPVEKSGWVSY